jgi:hypothetical protein
VFIHPQLGSTVIPGKEYAELFKQLACGSGFNRDCWWLKPFLW